MITVVTPADPLTLVSLEEAKSWLKVDYADDDAIITMLIKSAYNEAERITNSSILVRTLKAVFDTCLYKNPFTLPYGPVKSITSVVSDGEDITDYTILDGSLYLEYPYILSSHDKPIDVVYEAGQLVAEVSEGIKEFILKTVFSSYDIRGNEVTGTEGIKVSNTKITRDAKEILRPYVRYI